MSFRDLITLLLTASFVTLAAAPARAQDAQICFNAQDRVTDGETLSEEEKKKAHESCLRAFSDTASIVQKYHLQEADFDIMGNRPKSQ